MDDDEPSWAVKHLFRPVKKPKLLGPDINRCDLKSSPETPEACLKSLISIFEFYWIKIRRKTFFLIQIS
jgi:hypothetical protein